MEYYLNGIFPYNSFECSENSKIFADSIETIVSDELENWTNLRNISHSGHIPNKSTDNEEKEFSH